MAKSCSLPVLGLGSLPSLPVLGLPAARPRAAPRATHRQRRALFTVYWNWGLSGDGERTQQRQRQPAHGAGSVSSRSPLGSSLEPVFPEEPSAEKPFFSRTEKYLETPADNCSTTSTEALRDGVPDRLDSLLHAHYFTAAKSGARVKPPAVVPSRIEDCSRGPELAQLAEAARRYPVRDTALWRGLLRAVTAWERPRESLSHRTASAPERSLRPQHLLRVLYAAHCAGFHDVAALDALAERLLPGAGEAELEDMFTTGHESEEAGGGRRGGDHDHCSSSGAIGDAHRFFRELDFRQLAQLAAVISSTRENAVVRSKSPLGLEPLIRLAASERGFAEPASRGRRTGVSADSENECASARTKERGFAEREAFAASVAKSRAAVFASTAVRRFATVAGLSSHFHCDYTRHRTSELFVQFHQRRTAVHIPNSSTVILPKKTPKAERKSTQEALPGPSGAKIHLVKQIRKEKAFLSHEMQKDENQVVGAVFALRNHYRELADRLFDAVLRVVRKRQHAEEERQEQQRINTRADDDHSCLRPMFDTADDGRDPMLPVGKRGRELQAATAADPRAGGRSTTALRDEFCAWRELLTALHKKNSLSDQVDGSEVSHSENDDLFQRGAAFVLRLLEGSSLGHARGPAAAREVLDLVRLFCERGLRHEKMLLAATSWAVGSACSVEDLRELQGALRLVAVVDPQLDRFVRCRT